jgi:hypothetical protein
MVTKLIIADDFYESPIDVRNFALSQEFDVTGNFPNARTKSFSNENVKTTIQEIIATHGGLITYWPEGYNGAFQFTTAQNRSWIHADDGTTWAAVVYLTPDAPLSGGSGLFRHKATGLSEMPDSKEKLKEIYLDSQDMTKWEILDRVGNVFNRIVIYRGSIFHTSLDYFGKDKYDGRLFQTFFFSTEF